MMKTKRWNQKHQMPFQKNERIYLSIGLGIFALVGGLFFPFPANLMPLVGIPMIIKQIRELLK